MRRIAAPFEDGSIAGRGWGRAGLCLTAAFWFFGLAVPILSLLASAREFPLLLDPVILRIARFTFLQALGSSTIAALLGLPLGMWIGKTRSSSRGDGWATALDALLVIPFGVPAVVAANAWVICLGHAGWLEGLGFHTEWLYSLKAVVLAHVVFNVPWIALLVAKARRAIPKRQLEAAALLGAGERARFRWVVWPRIRFAFLAAWAQAQTFCAMSFVLVLVLGGGPPVDTLETAIYSRIRFGALDLSGAVACGIWELLVTLAPWTVVLWLESRDSSAQAGAAESPTESESWGEQGERVRPPAARSLLLKLALILVAVIWTVPYLAVLNPESLGRFLDPVFISAVHGPLLVSLGISALVAAATVLAASAGVLAANHVRSVPGAASALAIALAIPGGISVLALGLGYWLAYGRWIDPFSGSLPAIVSLQVVLFSPLAFRMMRPLLFHSPRGLLEAAASLGATPAEAFRWVEWPRWWPVLLSVFSVVVAVSLGEVSAVVLFYSEDRIPLALLLSRWMNQYRFEDARALSALLFLLAAGTISAWMGFGKLMEHGFSNFRGRQKRNA